MRKKPKQIRSQEMVDTLLQATARALARHGMALTTRHIAEEARVSVGSLYQYFEDKEALLEALTAKLVGEVASTVQRRMTVGRDLDLHTAFRTLLGDIVALLHQDEGYLVLAQHWHELRVLRAVDTAERYFLDAFQMYVMLHHTEYRFANLPAALYVVYSSVAFTVIRYLSHPHPALTQEEMVDALTDMAVGYFEQSRVK